MERKDFKKITKKHILACKWIVEEEGKCSDFQNCDNCPFVDTNNTNDDNLKGCRIYSGNTSRNKKNPLLLYSAKKFLKLFSNDIDEEKIKKYDVKVETINGLYPRQLEDIIKGYLNNGFEIQNSQIQWYCGTVEEVYVFVKELKGE